MTPVVLYPAQVQGEGAGAQVARAIEIANARAECDVLIVCRGGGSLEDLWAFNEEAVARAIVASRLPVVSGVGHETDFSIADFVADRRAETPTAAAVCASADREALLATLEGVERRLARDARRAVELRVQRLDAASRRLLTPAERLGRSAEHVAQLARRLRRALPDFAARRRELERWRARLEPAMARALATREQRLRGLATALGHLDPRQVLSRGYSIVRDARGQVVRSARDVERGQALDVTFAEGGAGVTVRDTR